MGGSKTAVVVHTLLVAYLAYQAFVICSYNATLLLINSHL